MLNIYLLFYYILKQHFYVELKFLFWYELWEKKFKNFFLLKESFFFGNYTQIFNENFKENHLNLNKIYCFD